MRRIAIRSSLVGALLTVIVLLSAAILAVNFHAGKQIADDLAARYLSKTADVVERRMDGFFDPVVANLENARKWAHAGVVRPEDVEACNAVYLPVLQAYPQVTSIATGDEAGYSYRLGAEGANFLNRLTYAGEAGRPAEYALRKPDGTLIQAHSKPTAFDPRKRPWYAGARTAYERAGSAAAAEVSWTQPFILNTSKNPGIAASLPFEDPGGGVYMMTFNVMLTKLSDFSAGLRPTEHGVAFLLSPEGRVLGFPADDRFPTPESRVAFIKKNGNEMPALDAFGVPALETCADLWRGTHESRQPARVRFEIDAVAWHVRFRPYTLGTHDAQTLWIGVLVPEDDFLAQVKKQRKLILIVSGLALLGAAILALFLARIFSRPLRELAEQSERMTSLDLAPGDSIRTHVVETHQLAAAQERMRAALDSFSRYIPKGVVRELLRRGEAAQLGGQALEITVLFSDIRSFTTISESMEPTALTEHLAEYFQSMLDIVRDEGGAVDKMIGDAIMALFGAPVDDPDHARHALLAALRCQAFLDDFNARCESQGRPALHTGLGLSTGPAFVGNIGAPSRLNYTALGDVVNLSSRLEGLTKRYGCSILCAQSVQQAAGEGFAWRQVDLVAVKGKTKPVRIFEPLGLVGEVPEERLAFTACYERAFQAYLARDFEGALAALEDASNVRPDDKSAQRLQGLCRTYLDAPPPEDWDGAIRMQEK